MSNSRVRKCCTYVAVAGASIGLFASLNSTPIFANSSEAQAAVSASDVKRVMPIAEGRYRISTPFGVAGPMWASGHHTGLDLGAESGTTIVAAQAGTVTFTGNGGPYGNLTKIDHGGGVETWYAHQSAFLTGVGQQVRAGQPIGAVGSTGNSTGPHLHFEVRIDGQISNPSPWLAGAPAVPAVGLAGQIVDAGQAEDLKVALANAAGELRDAQAKSEDAAVEEAKVRKKLEKAKIRAEKAKKVLADYAREVYKSGADPKFLLQADAITSGNLTDFSDREVLLAYSNAHQNRQVNEAIDAIQQADLLHKKAESIRATAAANLSAANTRYESLFGALKLEEEEKEKDAKEKADKVKAKAEAKAKADAKAAAKN